MARRTVWLPLVCAGVGLLPAAWAQDLASVEKKILAGWEKQTSVTANVTTEMKTDTPYGPLERQGTGTVAMERRGGKLLARMEMKQVTIGKQGEQEIRMEQPLTTVIDGQYAHHYTEFQGQKMAVKTDIQPEMTLDTAPLLQTLHKEAELKLLPDETVDGIKTYVLEATFKQPSANEPPKRILYFDQNTGLLVKATFADATGKPLGTLALTDIKYGVKIDPEQFVLKLPEGVQEMDRTEPATAPASQAAASGPTSQPAPAATGPATPAARPAAPTSAPARPTTRPAPQP